MAIDRDQKYREMANRGKYQRLYSHLCGLQAEEWQTSFGEIESIMGFALPPTARLHRPWWANQMNGHSHALAWMAAGWKTEKVKMEVETLVFRRLKGLEAVRKPSLDEFWPVHPTAVWPEGLSLRREDMYEDRM